MSVTDNTTSGVGWFQHSALSSRLSKSVAVMASGHALGYVVLFLTTPLITRLFHPSAFGLLATYSSLMSFFGTSICLRYDAAIPIPKKSEDAKCLAFAALICAVLGSLLFALVSFFFGPVVASWGKVGLLVPYANILAANLTGYGFFQIGTFIATRDRQFASLAQLRLVLVVSTVCTQLTVGFLYPGPYGLLLGQLVGYWVGALFILALSRSFFQSMISMKSLYQVVIDYRRFPLFGTWSESLHISQTVLPPLLLVAAYGDECAGWFLLAWRIVGAPMTLLGVPIARVFFSEASRLATANPEKVREFFLYTLKKGFLVAAPIIIFVALISTKAFPLFFGLQWEESGVYSQLLCPLLLCHLLSYSVRSTFDITNRQDLQLLSSLIGVFLTILGVLLPAYLGLSSVFAIGSLSICSCASHFSSIALSYYSIGAQHKSHIVG